MASDLELQLLGDSPSSWAVPLSGGLIGRAAHCDWVVPDPQRLVSREHARLHWQEGRCYWVDLGTNSSAINGKTMPAKEAVPLSVGDRLRVGGQDIVVAQGSTQWSVLDEYLPEKKPAEPNAFDLEAGLSEAMPSSIDDLLAGLGEDSMVSHSEPQEQMPTPVLAQRMYVGSQNKSPDVQRPPSTLPQPGPSVERRLLELCIEGCMELLRLRRFYRQEWSGELTSLSPAGNNPLKICESTDEAVALLLSDGARGYLSAPQAIEQAFGDLRHHQQQSLEHSQKVVAQLEQQLSPTEIERHVPVKSVGLLGTQQARKAALWDEYCSRHEALKRQWS